jgi:8-oxo-dGTP diphosphatase
VAEGEQRKTDTSSAMKRYRVGVLLYFRNEAGQVLLIRRSKRPNLGLWCAVGGKLEMESGESPFECAIREAREEVGVSLQEEDLALRCSLSERNYEGTGHWLMFLFEIRKRLSSLPKSIDEGVFGFFDLEELPALKMPPLDRKIAIERILNSDASAFSALRAPEGTESDPKRLVVEQETGNARGVGR